MFTLEMRKHVQVVNWEYSMLIQECSSCKLRMLSIMKWLGRKEITQMKYILVDWFF